MAEYRIRKYDQNQIRRADTTIFALDQGQGDWYVEYWSRVERKWMPYSSHRTREDALARIRWIYWMRRNMPREE